MKKQIAITFFLILLTGCHTLTQEQQYAVNTFGIITDHVKDNFVYKEQIHDVWPATLGEIDLRNVDCDGIALYMGYTAVLAGVNPGLFYYGMFIYNEDLSKSHMAIVTDDAMLGHTYVIPSSGMRSEALSGGFILLDQYEQLTDMTLIESFQIKLVEEDNDF